MTILSVVIPTFNSALTIDKCLESLVCQTYQDFEICIIDADSSDGTLARVNQFHSKFQNIRIISEPDSGIYDAMNKGIRFSKGEWIYFLGSDDEMYSNDIFSTIFLNESNLEVDILYGNVCSKLLGDCYDGEFSLDKLYTKNICHQAIFTRRHVFEKVGSFDVRYKVLADYDFNIRCFCAPQIKRKFIDCIISNYSGDGFSSFNEDLLFMSHKPLIFLKKGFIHLSFENQINIFRSLKHQLKFKSYILLLVAFIKSFL